MTIVIDGNIGAGKTTQLNHLEKLGHSVKREPVNDWPLEKFYRNPSSTCFMFQIAVLYSNLKRDEYEVYERGILPGRMVFWEDLLLRGIVKNTDEHFWYDKLFEELKWFPDTYIFLDIKPERSLERIKHRVQAGDKSITLPLLQSLYSRYKYMIERIKDKCPVYIIDGELPEEEILRQIKNIIQVPNSTVGYT